MSSTCGPCSGSRRPSASSDPLTAFTFTVGIGCTTGGVGTTRGSLLDVGACQACPGRWLDTGCPGAATVPTGMAKYPDASGVPSPMRVHVDPGEGLDRQLSCRVDSARRGDHPSGECGEGADDGWGCERRRGFHRGEGELGPEVTGERPPRCRTCQSRPHLDVANDLGRGRLDRSFGHNSKLVVEGPASLAPVGHVGGPGAICLLGRMSASNHQSSATMYPLTLPVTCAVWHCSGPFHCRSGKLSVIVGPNGEARHGRAARSGRLCRGHGQSRCHECPGRPGR